MEVLLGMTLTPAVADALLASHPGPRAVVGAARAQRASKGKERAHLLLLYGTLCECVMVAEPRIRCVGARARRKRLTVVVFSGIWCAKLCSLLERNSCCHNCSILLISCCIISCNAHNDER